MAAAYPSYRELRDIPIEAVSRVDILPAEVALKYGYPPDQKVVNVVLQNRFSETVALAAANMARMTAYTGGGGDLTRILLLPEQRATLNLHAGHRRHSARLAAQPGRATI